MNRLAGIIGPGTVLAVLAVLAAGLASAGAAAQTQWRWTDVPRVVAVADVHGAYEELVELLRLTGVVDDALAWSGADAHLVSLGDLLDRGPRSRAVMDLLMRLQREAPEHGGAVHVVLGNHEVMNLVGDLRYVSASEYAEFAEDEPEGAREAAFQRFVAQQTNMATAEARALFEQRYPPGYFGHRAAFRADGLYGAWLLSLPALIVIDDTAFVHGGLPEIVARDSAGEINAAITDALRRYLALRDRLANAGVLPPVDMARDLELAAGALAEARDGGDSPVPASELEHFLSLAEPPVLGLDGPLWYRGAAYCHPLVEAPILEAALARLGAGRVIVGHTVTNDRYVRALYDGRLIKLDTGMLTEYYGGRPAALIIEPHRSYVQYAAPAEQRAPEPDRVEAFRLTAEHLRDALLNGTIEPDAAGGSGPSGAQAVRLRHDDALVQAWLYPRGRSNNPDELELAAYELDRMLGLELVPVTVARMIDGEQRTLQLRYADAITEAERIERRVPIGTWCPIEPQLQLLYAFDLLVFNAGRSADNVLLRRDASALRLIDHGRAFGTGRQISFPGDTLQLPDALVEGLAALDEPALQSRVGQWLNTRQIRALLARRDQILALVMAD